MHICCEKSNTEIIKQNSPCPLPKPHPNPNPYNYCVKSHSSEADIVNVLYMQTLLGFSFYGHKLKSFWFS